MHDSDARRRCDAISNADDDAQKVSDALDVQQYAFFACNECCLNVEICECSYE